MRIYTSSFAALQTPSRSADAAAAAATYIQTIIYRLLAEAAPYDGYGEAVPPPRLKLVPQRPIINH